MTTPDLFVLRELVTGLRAGLLLALKRNEELEQALERKDAVIAELLRQLETGQRRPA